MISAGPPTVTIVHTSFVSIRDLTALFADLGPDVRLRHMVDDGLLPEVIENGCVTARVRARLLACFRVAAEDGCDVILSQCSSVGEVAELVGSGLGVPVLRMDEPMARRACELAGRVAVVATLRSTLEPTRRLVESSARTLGARVEVETCLVEGAFELLRDGDTAAHDRKVRDAILQQTEGVDVVVCAQGSMAAALDRFGELRGSGAAQRCVPVLTSPRAGVARAIELAREAFSSR
jgi:hypothetical protein